MALVKKPRMTEKKLSALRRNARLSNGPATAKGRARIRAAHLRHGYYSKSGEEALRSLGENPADFQELLRGLQDKGTAIATLQQRLAHRLARALWRMDRTDRMLEGCALRQAKEEDYTREARLHMQMMRLKMISRNWQLLAQAVARPKYVTTAEDLEMMRNLQKEGLAKEMCELAFALFYQLQEPGALRPGDPGFEDEEHRAKTHRVMNQIRAIFALPPLPEDEEDADAGTRQGVSGQDVAPNLSSAHADPAPCGISASETDVAPDFSPAHADPSLRSGQALKVGATEGVAPAEAEEVNPYPDITEEEWEVREPVRQLLENILSRQVKILDAQHQDLLRECLTGPSAYERAAEIVPSYANSKLIQRLEESQCRQLTRLTGLLIRLRRHERQMERLEKSLPEAIL
jgi:hypothetical protein